MSYNKYTLDVVSHHPEFKNKSLRKYYVDGIETIGAWGNEPFEIKFKNLTGQKVQVKLSLDGTDILTGAPATTEVNKDMWVVNAWGTLTLKAWPETSNGGSQFVFTSADKSVAVHTHGDLTSRGIIAAAVYTEGHVEPVRLNPAVEHHHHHYPVRRSIYDLTFGYPTWSGGGTYGSNTIGGDYSKGGTRKRMESNTTTTLCDASPSGTTGSINTLDIDHCREVETSDSLESLVSVGAGQHVDQKITYVTGLIKPILTETVRVKYLWWDDLKAKLASSNVPVPHASGFPGDVKQNIMSIGNTPKVGYTQPAFPRAEAMPAYSRF